MSIRPIFKSIHPAFIVSPDVIRWYAWFYLLGLLWAAGFYAAYTVRQAVEFIVRIADGISAHDVLLIVITLVPFAIVVGSWVRT